MTSSQALHGISAKAPGEVYDDEYGVSYSPSEAREVAAALLAAADLADETSLTAEFDPAELARLADAAYVEGWNSVTQLGHYVTEHRDTIVAALGRVEALHQGPSEVGEPPGYDDRKQLADIWQANGGTVPGSLNDIYEALIAVATYGWRRRGEDMS